jgi:signal transduction histidine kinase
MQSPSSAAIPVSSASSSVKPWGLAVLRVLWWLLVPLAIGLTAAGLPARLRHLTGVGNAPVAMNVYELSLEVVLALAFFAMGILLVWKRMDNPLAIFMSLTLIMLGATETGMTDSFINPEFSSASQLWRWPVFTMRALAMIGALLLFYLFPDGRFVPRWTRWLALGWTLLTLIWLLFPAVPFNTIYGPTWRATPIASYLFAVAWFATGPAAQIYRHRRVSGHVERQQSEWLAAGLIGALLGGLAYYGLSVIDNVVAPGFMGPAYSWLRPTFRTLFMALLPICIAVAILRYRLLDIDLLIEGTLLYGALTAAVVAIYVAVVTGLGAIIGTRSTLFVSVVATALVAVLFQPLRAWIQRGVTRLLYGERDNPYAVLSRIGRDLEVGAPSHDALLESMARTVAEALRLPYAAITTASSPGQTPQAGQAGQRGAFGVLPDEERLVATPLHYLGEEVGSLTVATRSAREPLSPGDRRLLDDLARQAAIAVSVAQTSMDLQQSRGALITAREEERRRLRRDLHDGLGPSLAGLSFRLDAARNLLTRDPQRADAQLEAAGDQLRAAIADIRRLVYDLRPPALDEFGLAQALTHHLESLSSSSVHFSLEVPAPLPPLSAAVEVAAFRVVQEACTNVLRHSGARSCRARLAIEGDSLEVTVIDDGRGLAPQARAGVGLQAMRERAAELGGSFELSEPAAGGVQICARLPLLRPAAASTEEGRP